MRVSYLIALVLLFAVRSFINAQDIPKWDNPAGENWPPEFKIATTQSKLDDSIQNIIFYKATGSEPRPLIISFHTWSGDYKQDDPVAILALKNNWNYIHPDFRGAVSDPKSCGSKYVISDIGDAIDFAINTLNVKENDIHIIGVSGGGYTALVSYLKLKRPIKSFSVWVPLSDLESWYWESFGRKNKYADDLVRVSGGATMPDFKDLKKRSPLLMDMDKLPNPNAKLSIYTGIHDGYTGSVPITQSINFYNKLIKSQGAKKDQKVSKSEIISLVTKRCNPDFREDMEIGSRKVHLFKSFGNVSLTVFEGGHEMLTEVAIESIKNE